MSATIALVEGEGEGVDRSALLLMLSYIEAECRRLGATAAAHHAALAAALVPGHGTAAASVEVTETSTSHPTLSAMRRRRAPGRLH